MGKRALMLLQCHVSNGALCVCMLICACLFVRARQMYKTSLDLVPVLEQDIEKQKPNMNETNRSAVYV